MDTKIYLERRRELRRSIADGAILLLGLNEAPRNYLANPYPFRQDSHLLYYTGINLPDVALLILPDGKEFFYGSGDDIDTIVWTGPHPSVADTAASAGLAHSDDISRLKDQLDNLVSFGLKINYLPPYRIEQALKLSVYLNLPIPKVAGGASPKLVQAVARQRSIKSADEVAEIEDALSVTAAMYQAALQNTRPGKLESEIAGLMQGLALAKNREQAFLPIVSIHGEVLHNNYYGNTMRDGDLLLIDSGVESPHWYASDITRTFPVSGSFTEQQKGIYQVVLNAQLAVIAAASPRVSNRDLHFIAARAIADGLKDLGLMRGDMVEAVRAGAHALFFPHGIGHMLGLDVHDMEDLGDVVGYPPDEKRSTQFGLGFLRLARRLEPGFVITNEPGVYFVPPLIDLWESEKKHEVFINYEEARRYRGFGGIRIEDDLLITADGCRVLGPAIPKTIRDIELSMKG